MQEKNTHWLRIVLITAATAVLGGLFSMNSKEFYNPLNKPPFAPPSIVFPIVWGILYVCMALAMILYFRNKGYTPLYFRFYVANLVLNAMWPLFFFALQMLCFPIFILLAMLVINLILISELKSVKIAFYLYLPYILWQLFALYLNISICVLN